MADMKHFEEINRVEWIRWNWIAVTAFADRRTQYLRGSERDANEAEQAGRDFDTYLAAWRATQDDE